MAKTEPVWQASEARNHLPQVMQRALAGAPQIIRHRSGGEVVVIAKAEYDRMKPTLKEFLLGSAGAAGADDDAPLQESLRRLRATGAAGFVPRSPRGRSR
jgi:prevent-host-death family protein